MSSANICINSDALKVAKAMTEKENEVLKKTNKFKETLDTFSENIPDCIDERFEGYDIIEGNFRKGTIATIRLALRIAQAVTEEPSEGMKCAGSESSYKLDEVRPSVAAKIFRAMIEQMLIELKA